MSNQENQSAAAFTDDYNLQEPQQDHGGVADELKSVLKLIAAQIEDSNRHHAEVLGQMHERLVELGDDARRTRAKVPETYAPAFERIQDGIALLAERISEAGVREPAALPVDHDSASPADAAAADALFLATASPAGQVANSEADDFYAEIETQGYDRASGTGERTDEQHQDDFEASTMNRPANADDAVNGYDGAELAGVMPLRSATPEVEAHDDGFSGSQVTGQHHEGDYEDDALETAGSTRPGNPEAPWDEVDAEALTRVIEDDRALFRSTASGHSMALAAPSIAQDYPDMTPALNLSAEPQVDKPATAVRQEPAFDAAYYAEEREAERQWLDERFVEIAERIEQALIEMRPDDQLHELGDRFERLQEQIAEAMESLSANASGEGMKHAESQLEELISQVQQMQAQAGRLDTIEEQLQELMQRFSDDRLTQMFSEMSAGMGASMAAGEAYERPDFDAIANAAAETVAARFADLQKGGESVDSSELRALLETLLVERREGEAQTVGTLDTIQQAMISVLDRVEAIEQLAQMSGETPQGYADDGFADDAHAPAARSLAHDPHETDFETNAPEHMSRGSEFEGDFEDDFAHERMSNADDEFGGQRPGAGHHHDENGSLPHDLEAHEDHAGHNEPVPGIIAPDLPPVNAIDRIRQEFIAEAQRAREKATAQEDEEATRIVDPKARRKGKGKKKAASAKSEKTASRFSIPGLSMKLPGSTVDEATSHSAGVDAALSGSGDPAAAGRSIFGLTRRKLLVGAFILLIATSGMLLMMPRNSDNADNAAPSFEQTIGNEQGLPAGITPPEGFEENMAPGQEDSPFESVPAPSGTGDRSQIIDGPIEGFGTTGSPFAPVALAKNPDGTLPGIAVQMQSARFDPAQIAMLQERQSMAQMSTNIGIAAAKATPASLLPEYQQVSGDEQPAPVSANGISRSLDLPPATVGPFSLRIAAAKGDPSAEFQVASRLAEGKGTDQNFKEAVRWYKRSASRGFAQSQYRLGTLYERGLGVDKDTGTASTWYQRAAEQGNVKAMHNLAVLSAGRAQGSPDYLTAAHWFGQAAERGLGDSQYNLAVLYENGLGVSKDLVQAHKLYALAARNGDKEAVKRRDAIKKELSSAEFLEASRLYAAWRVKPTEDIVNDASAAGEDWKSRENGSYSG